jgi:transglutaminase/protease-like cytokinesis protein 3
MTLNALKSFFLLLLVLPVMSHAPVSGEQDFQQVDRLARQVRKSATLESTADKLTESYKTDLEKVRAIFVWVTHNVAYDIQKVREQQRRNNRTVITANSQAELDAYLKKMPRKMAETAFSKGKGVCEDYSNLFLYMCQSVGIEASYITGYARSSTNKLNKYPDRSNHVWNGVRIDGQWYLLDATWSAGQVDLQKGVFSKEFSDGFFLADPVKFLLTHFPDDPKWQLVGSPIDVDHFVSLPLAYPALHHPYIEDYFPKKGVVARDSGLIKLVLKTTLPASAFELYINNKYHSTGVVADEDRVVFLVDASGLKNAELTITRVGKETVIPLISYLVI